jgi:hypothetical protein
MPPCHAERRPSVDPDGSITALIFYEWKGAYHHVFLHTKHMSDGGKSLAAETLPGPPSPQEYTVMNAV